MSKTCIAVYLTLLAFSVPSPGQTPESAPSGKVDGIAAEKSTEWRVDDPPGPRRHIRFETTEGTWMSLDVSPDGREIVFDMLGDLWTMPIDGGEAKLLRGGIPFDLQPRFSPDGKSISFTSDAGGGDNIWIMDRDGKNARQVTKENFRLLNNAVWMRNGEYLTARKHFTAQRSLGAGEMWTYRVSGGDGLRLTTKPTDQKDVGEPAMSADGRLLYYSEDTSQGSTFEYNKNPHGRIYTIKSLDLSTGETKDVLALNGGAARPCPSPDGKLLAFVHRVRMKSVLAVLDLSTGEIRDLFDGLNRDQQETWAIFGVYPNFAFMPDSSAIVVWAQGGFFKVAVADGKASRIPFKASVDLEVSETVRPIRRIADKNFDVKVIRWPKVSPDGRTALFTALGRTYIKNLPDGVPTLVKESDALEFAPAFAPDSVAMVHATWNDRTGGSIEFVYLDENRVSHPITTEPGHYHEPEFSPDQKLVVFRRSTGDDLRGVDRNAKTGLYIADLVSGSIKLLHDEGRNPRFSADGKRVFAVKSQGSGSALIEITLDASEPKVKTVASSAYAAEIVLSPDETTIAWVELFQVYIAPFLRTGREISLSPSMSSLPVKKLTKIGGEFLSYSPDSKVLRWSLGPDLFEIDVASVVPGAFAKAPDSLPEPRRRKLGFSAASDIPETRVVLDHARIVTMRGREIIDDGRIVIEGDRIVDVGPRSEVAVPDGFAVRDLAGSTVLPGFVDVHSHMGRGSGGISPQSSWALLANLAFGVTTVHDPSADTKSVFAESEMVKAGVLQGPRVFSTGTILYGADGGFKAVIDSPDDARNHLTRLAAWGAFSVKSYNQPRRNQRQQVIAAARELGMAVVPEGGSTFFHNLNQIVDGHTTIEHALPIAPIYRDVVTLFAQSGTAYTPTLIVGYGGIWGENYWYAHTPVWENRRLMNFVPRTIVDERAIRREIAPEADYHHIRLAEGAAAVKRAGGTIEIGAHGQIQGLGAHWEMWMFAQGGLSPHEVLEAATLGGARALGLDGEIGRIAPGLLADLVIYPREKDPLTQISFTEHLAFVMKGGRLFDAMTLDQVLPVEKKRREGPKIELLDREHLTGPSCACEGGHSH